MIVLFVMLVASTKRQEVLLTEFLAELKNDKNKDDVVRKHKKEAIGLE